jgi:predicted nuclease of predicted toxin-antitoxin system
MRFLVDRCAGRRLAEWLHSQGHDVLEARELGPDPGDRALLERAAAEGRILVTIDTDFGELVYVEAVPHRGLVRFPDVPAERRIALIGPGSRAASARIGDAGDHHYSQWTDPHLTVSVVSHSTNLRSDLTF